MNKQKEGRVKYIEEYLVSQGYVCSGSSPTAQYWVDYLQGGHDISFDTVINPPATNSSFLRDPICRALYDNYFTIHINVKYVETADDVIAAVQASRSRAKLLSSRE